MAGNSSDEDDDDSPTHPAAAPASPLCEPESPIPDPTEPVVLLSSQEDHGGDDDDARADMEDAVLRDEGTEPRKKVLEDEKEPSSGSNGDSTVPPSLNAVVDKNHIFGHDTDEDTKAQIKALQKLMADAKKLQTAKSLYSLNWFLLFRFLISTKPFGSSIPNSYNLIFWH